MNCSEFQELAVARTEGLLPPEICATLDAHLVGCATCRQQNAALSGLQEQLMTHARIASGVAIVPTVMRRVQSRRVQIPRPRASILGFPRWAFGLGAAAAAIALFMLLGTLPASRANATSVLERGLAAAANLSSIHLKARMRTPPADNFGSITPKAAFVSIELWKELSGQNRWRVEKPGRVAAMDGHSTVLFIRPETALRVPSPNRSAFDTEWLHLVGDIEATLTNALAMARHGWKTELTKQTDAAGTVHALVTIDTGTGLPVGDYLANKFIGTAATRRIFRFDDVTGRLEALQIYMQQETDYVLIFEVTQIAYNETFAANVFEIILPPNVRYVSDPVPVANNARYAEMTPEEAARAFFDACAREDWTEVEVFFPLPLNDRIKQHLGGLKLLNLGASFASTRAAARFVPYEIELRNGQTKKHNLALKMHPKVGRWLVDGGI